MSNMFIYLILIYYMIFKDYKYYFRLNESVISSFKCILTIK